MYQRQKTGVGVNIRLLVSAHHPIKYPGVCAGNGGISPFPTTTRDALPESVPS